MRILKRIAGFVAAGLVLAYIVGPLDAAAAGPPKVKIEILRLNLSAQLHGGPNAGGPQLLAAFDALALSAANGSAEATLRQFDLSIGPLSSAAPFTIVFVSTAPDGEVSRILFPVAITDSSDSTIRSPQLPANGKIAIYAENVPEALEGTPFQVTRETRRTWPGSLGGKQSAHGNAFWISPEALISPPASTLRKQLIDSAQDAVVSLNIENKCTDDQTDCDPNTYCTAFRIGPALFATNWHCMHEFQAGSCAKAAIRFKFHQKGTRAPLEPIRPLISEHCTDVKYLNSNLDVAIFETSQNFIADWSGVPVLRFAGSELKDGTARYPFAGENLALLHYPATNRSCKFPRGEPSVGEPYGLRISIFDEPDGQEDCRVLGYTKRRDGACRNPRNNQPQQCIEWASIFDFNADEPIPSEHQPWTPIEHYHAKRPLVAFRHECATCEGSSGAPIISLTEDDAASFGRVLGIHQGSSIDQQDKDHWPANNIAIRTSAVSECVDIFRLHEGNVALKYSEKSRSICTCKLPSECTPAGSGWQH